MVNHDIATVNEFMFSKWPQLRMGRLFLEPIKKKLTRHDKFSPLNYRKTLNPLLSGPRKPGDCAFWYTFTFTAFHKARRTIITRLFFFSAWFCFNIRFQERQQFSLNLEKLGNCAAFESNIQLTQKLQQIHPSFKENGRCNRNVDKPYPPYDPTLGSTLKTHPSVPT